MATQRTASSSCPKGDVHPDPPDQPGSADQFSQCLPERHVIQLVLQVPAPVIADALGFHHTTTTRQHAHAGAPWSRYIGGGVKGLEQQPDGQWL
jgi:hypothetical protein